jgi:hypothetical protein
MVMIYGSAYQADTQRLNSVVAAGEIKSLSYII